MKIILFFCISLFSCYTARSQEGVTVSLEYDATYNLISGTYAKDINNTFEPYLGTWTTSWNGKTLTLLVQKVEHYSHDTPSGYYYYRDIMTVKYEVKYAVTGVILNTTMNISDVNDAKITSSAGNNIGMYFTYSDMELCNNTGEIYLKRNPDNLNELTYYYYYNDFWLPEDCPYLEQNDIPIPIPTGVVLVLTKVI